MHQAGAFCKLRMLLCGSQAFLMVLCVCCLRHHQIRCVRCALVAVLMIQCTTFQCGVTESGLPGMQPSQHHCTSKDTHLINPYTTSTASG